MKRRRAAVTLQLRPQTELTLKARDLTWEQTASPSSLGTQRIEEEEKKEREREQECV